MSQLRRLLVLMSAGSALLLAGCSAAPAVTTPASPPAGSTPVPSAAVTIPSASPSATVAACPSGDYTVTSFKATGKSGTLGNGTGGDISAEFENGRYEVDFDDDSPIALTIAGSTGELIVDGSIEGTYTGSGTNLTFKQATARGTAKVRYQGKTRTVPFKQVASVLGLSGKAAATCSGDKLTLEAGQTTFQMVRDA